MSLPHIGVGSFRLHMSRPARWLKLHGLFFDAFDIIDLEQCLHDQRTSGYGNRDTIEDCDWLIDRGMLNQTFGTKDTPLDRSPESMALADIANGITRRGIKLEAELDALLAPGRLTVVSIHAPVKEATRCPCVPLRVGLDVRMERPGYDPFPQRDLGFFSYAVSRPTIERAVRRRVESRANIRLRQRCRVKELLASPNGETVSGVRYESDNGASETIATDLVVDASGRGALTLALLQSINRPLPEETTIGIDLGYATCVFAIPDDASADWKGVMTFGQASQNSRGGLMLPLEGNRWRTPR